MNDVNLEFLIYFVDERGAREVKAELERVLDCQLAPQRATAHGDEIREAFGAKTMGLSLGLRRVSVWPEGNVYRLAGGTESGLHSPSAVEVCIDSHLARVLHHGGIAQVISPEEYAARELHYRGA